jgi:hypothetical protein
VFCLSHPYTYIKVVIMDAPLLFVVWHNSRYALYSQITCGLGQRDGSTGSQIFLMLHEVNNDEIIIYMLPYVHILFLIYYIWNCRLSCEIPPNCFHFPDMCSLSIDHTSSEKSCLCSTEDIITSPFLIDVMIISLYNSHPPCMGGREKVGAPDYT